MSLPLCSVDNSKHTSMLLNNTNSELTSKSSHSSDNEEIKISIEHNIDHTTWEIVNSFLVKKGMKDHFESVLGGGMKTEVIKYIMH